MPPSPTASRRGLRITAAAGRRDAGALYCRARPSHYRVEFSSKTQEETHSLRLRDLLIHKRTRELITGDSPMVDMVVPVQVVRTEDACIETFAADMLCTVSCTSNDDEGHAVLRLDSEEDAAFWLELTVVA